MAGQGASLRSASSSTSTGVSPCQGSALGRLPAGVAKLYAGNRALRFQKFRNVAQLGGLAVLPKAEIAMGPPAARFDSRRFGKHQSRPAQREAAEMHHVPRIGVAIQRSVLAHWRNRDPVPKDDIPQPERFKKHAHGI